MLSIVFPRASEDKREGGRGREMIKGERDRLRMDGWMKKGVLYDNDYISYGYGYRGWEVIKKKKKDNSNSSPSKTDRQTALLGSGTSLHQHQSAHSLTHHSRCCKCLKKNKKKNSTTTNKQKKTPPTKTTNPRADGRRFI